ncbi:MAG: ATP-binding cassette domain-containing protein [Epsilonproteobacteria bacterium]|nr:ATP-binding cassette domain-containing protein [Campylobacterota bacterium]
MLKLKFKHLFLDIELEAEDSFAILGPNGSGKSLLLSVITHELYPQKLFKREVFGKTLTLKEARETFGVVNNALEYFYKNENISVFDAVISSFKNALVVYNFFDFSDEEKNKTKEILDFFSLKPNQAVSTLSLGEMKKLLIARALVHNPKILCLDEPTNGLDIKAKHQFLELIEGLDVKKIMITHDFSEVFSYGKIIMLSKGKIFKVVNRVEKEDIIELFGIDEKIYRRFYG